MGREGLSGPLAPPGGSGQDSCSASQMSRGSHSLLPVGGQLGEPWEPHLRGLGLGPPPTPREVRPHGSAQEALERGLGAGSLPWQVQCPLFPSAPAWAVSNEGGS